MIFNIRGTSGSGKTTLVKDVIGWLTAEGAVLHEHFHPGRKQPLWFQLTRRNGEVWSFIGHYNAACGGCDTINSMDWVFELVKERHFASDHLVFEGLIVCSDARRIIELAKEHRGQLKVINLKTDKEVCLEGIRARRTARGVDPNAPFKESVERNVKAKMRTCEKTAERIEAEAPGTVKHMTRDEARDYLYQYVRWTP